MPLLSWTEIRLVIGLVLVVLNTAAGAGIVATSAMIATALVDGDPHESEGTIGGSATLTVNNDTWYAKNVTACIAEGGEAPSPLNPCGIHPLRPTAHIRV